MVVSEGVKQWLEARERWIASLPPGRVAAPTPEQEIDAAYAAQLSADQTSCIASLQAALTQSRAETAAYRKALVATQEQLQALQAVLADRYTPSSPPVPAAPAPVMSGKHPPLPVRAMSASGVRLGLVVAP